MMYKDGFYRHRIVAVLTAIMIMSVFLVGVPHQTQGAQFIIAGWDHPDEFGQGIYAITLEQWIDPAWVSLANWYWTNQSLTHGLNSTLPLRFNVRCWVNNTVVGASDIVDGRNYLNHSVTVSTPTNSSIFYQKGFDFYYNQTYGDMFMYHYNVELAFTLKAGLIYTVRVTYEIFY